MHASTFGGNPIAARAGIATFEMIEQEHLLARALELSDQFRTRLDSAAGSLPRDPRSAGASA